MPFNIAEIAFFQEVIECDGESFLRWRNFFMRAGQHRPEKAATFILCPIFLPHFHETNRLFTTEVNDFERIFDRVAKNERLC